jgi:hypothetical protein
MSRARSTQLADLRGWGRLALDATLGLTGVVEAMHLNISRAPAILGAPVRGSTRGITGLVYSTIRSVTRLVGMAFEAATRRPQASAERRPSPDREAVLAALNGVVGDHLAATENPLAIPMRLRRDGRPLVLARRELATNIPDAGPRLVVLVHGSCQADLRWLRLGHDHGAALARDLGYTPVYLHYNTGLHVSTNGRSFADALEGLVREWPVPLDELVILAHSMGGLVTRSACHYGAAAGHDWLRQARAIVLLGTPHHGAPLERGGNWVDVLLGLSPYSAPIASLGQIRSAGVTDLRHGSVLDEDWEGRDRFERLRERPRPVPLPPGVKCHVIAATLARRPGLADHVLGDGLVPLDSALGHHAEPGRSLEVPESRRWVGRGMNHWDLLSHPDVYDRIKGWLDH